MSGQYKIQRDSQNGFSDFQTAHKVAKKGGCWENIKSCLGLLLLLAACGVIASLITGGSSAQTADTNCFPHKTLYTIQRIDIRSNDSRFSAAMGKTIRNKTYTVFDSKKDSLFGSCWIKIQGGWLLRRPTGSAIRPGSTKAQDTSVSDSKNEYRFDNGRCEQFVQGRWRWTLQARCENLFPVNSSVTPVSDTNCYTSSEAYVTGTMNIRSGPGTSYHKVGTASAGQSVTVSRSQHGADYCWLKVGKGWIAKTGRVSSNKPVIRASTTRTTSSAVYCPPVNEGSASFQSTMQQACNKLGRSSRWGGYFAGSRPASIGELRSHPSRGAKFSKSERQIEINPVYAGTHDITLVASLMIHESCHIYQIDEGRASSEKECYQMQIDYVTSIAPSRGDLLRQLRRYLAQHS